MVNFYINSNPSFMRVFFTSLLFIVLFSIDIHAQTNLIYSGLLSEKQNKYTGKNFKDSVKTVYSKTYVSRQTLSDVDRNNFIMNNDIRGYNYIYFDRHGSIKETFGSSLSDNYQLILDEKKIKSYEYDDKDWAGKSKYLTSLKQYYPISNSNLLIKLNRIKVQKEKEIIDDTIWQEYSENVYNYIYHKLGKIVEEQNYHVFRFGVVIENKTPKDEDLLTRKIFIYNDNGQVVNQKIIAGSYSKNKIPYTDLGTETQFCDDLQLQYTYDVLGRLTSVIMYSCNKIVAKEEYSYHPIKDYVETVKYYVTGPGEIANPTKNFIKKFNEQGDIIRKEFIPDSPEQNLKEKQRYYTYEYDSHNNWIKCNMYLEGTIEGEPTLVAERKIEYYN